MPPWAITYFGLMEFAKMHGCGNDFVVAHEVGDVEALGRAAPRLCDRRTGIGADGIVIVLPSSTADLRMRIFNADGSEAEMCGNGIRCAYRYARARGLCAAGRAVFQTGAGLVSTESAGERVRVNMGPPVLRAADIPVALSTDRVVDQPIVVGNRQLRFTAVSMGNPHAVFHVDALTDELVLGTGALVERHELFPRRVNAEFVVVESRDRVRMRVFERGVGETLACGTGACAAAVAGILTGRHGSPVAVELPGGQLDIEWGGRDDGPVWMTGPAVEVYTGTVASV